MIQTRDDLDLDWDAVFEAAAATGTALEVNGSPHRLDLAAERARRAIEAGCILSIDSDAHRTDELEYVRWGVDQARRAWAEAGNVLNTRTRDELLAWVAGSPPGSDPTYHPPDDLHRCHCGPRASRARRRGGLIVALTRLVEPADASLIAGLLPVVILLAGFGVLAVDESGARPFEALLVPAVLTGGTGAAIHLVPIGLGLIPALAGFAVLLDRVLAIELRLLGQPTGPTEQDRSRVLLGAVITAFIAFTGIATLVPGGLAEPGGAASGGPAVSEGWLLVMAVNDALVALLLGYRLALFRYGTAADAVRSALMSAVVIAVAAGAVRAVDLPRLVGPAVLTLVFYLWDALHGAAPARRREPRFLWESLLLAALALVVVFWNLRLRQ